MRRPAVISACIAVFALSTSALTIPQTIAPRASSKPGAPMPAERILRRAAAAHFPVARVVRQRRPAAEARAPRQPTAPAVPVPIAARRAPEVHTVQAGDSFWTISRRYGVTVESLAAANRLPVTAILQLGQKLIVPAAGETVATTHAAPATGARAQARAPRRPAPTTVHVVRSGETLWDIARRYGTRVEDLMVWNDLGHSEWIKPGQRLRLAVTQVPRHRQMTAQTRSGRPVMVDERAIQAAGPFLWPARGVVTSRFGWRYRRHHDGLDIAAPRGTPIYAARDGVVEFAGWRGGYGRVVFLDHGGGFVTVYGHASTLIVKPGQRVKKGQLIARVGCTGSCTGSHVHFEVRLNGRAQNPLPYLTSAQAKR
ncbi:MAG: peptidoglycan DD-metalloendopeptidase family protein [Armatimonadota bacterium]|nr:peptidoglycan DD-metalloendopeptidase family protein [Armatimonadota bacterium]